MKTENILVSIIMPAFNAQQYIHDSIESVLSQTHKKWELLIIDDGSTDNTANICKLFNDERISFYRQTHNGVSSARNLGLLKMRGQFFCFLDSDDILPKNSIKSRLAVFMENPQVNFVDGCVIYFKENPLMQIKKYLPSFRGLVYDELLKISSRCLFGPTWLVKRLENTIYMFPEHMSHAEDFAFYLSISKGRYYDFTTEDVLCYRVSGQSAMSNGRGLEKGYLNILSILRKDHSLNIFQWVRIKYKITKIMFLSYIFNYNSIFQAIKVLFKVPFY